MCQVFPQSSSLYYIIYMIDIININHSLYSISGWTDIFTVTDLVDRPSVNKEIDRAATKSHQSQ